MLELAGSKNGQMFAKLHVHIKRASRLPKMAINASVDSFVKMFLLPNRSSMVMKKTAVVKNDLNPVWDEKFKYSESALKELSTKRVLELTLWDSASKLSNDFIGGVRIGPTPKPDQKEFVPDEGGHWEKMLECPGEWIERSHSLMSTMKYKPNVDKVVRPTFVFK